VKTEKRKVETHTSVMTVGEEETGQQDFDGENLKKLKKECVSH
jgi:hypothetical protein